MQLQIPYQPEIQLEIERDRPPYNRINGVKKTAKSDLVSCVCGQCDNRCGRFIPKTDQKLSDSEK